MNALSPSIAALAFMLALSSCADDGSPDDGLSEHPDAVARADASMPDLPVLALPTHGVQIATSGRHIPAGADQEWCEIAALPGDPNETFYVGRTELAMTPFSHHLIVSIAAEGSHSLDGLKLGAPKPCLGAHEYGTDLTVLAGSAKPYTEAVLPDRIGYTMHGGQRLVFDYHSLNTSDHTIVAAHKLNLHFVDAVEKRARTFGFYNQYIAIPAHTRRAFADQCTVKDDLLVWGLTRHTHRYGTRFRVWWVGGAHDGELLWTSNNWETEIEYDFDPPITLNAGTGFRWECAYENSSDQPLTFGTRATDEMCILFGSFATAGDDDADIGPQSCYLFAPTEYAGAQPTDP